jgi:hypothetical protein
VVAFKIPMVSIPGEGLGPERVCYSGAGLSLQSSVILQDGWPDRCTAGPAVHGLESRLQVCMYTLALSSIY